MWTGAFERVIRETGAEVFIADGLPGLLSSYARLGIRTNGAPLSSFGVGVRVPVVGLCADGEHLRTLGSPPLRIGNRLLRDGSRRRSSVRCPVAGQLLVIRRPVLEKRKRKNPAEATEVLEALAGDLADRF